MLRRLGADDITLCDLALREGLVLDYIHRNSARDPQGRALSRRPAPQRRRARRAVRLLVGARAAGRAARAGDLRPDAQRPRARRPRARVARVRRAAARRRRAHQLRAAPPPFVLPDQERRAARVRSAGDRGDRAHRALPPAGDAEEDRTRATATAEGPLRRTVQDAGRDGAAGRRARPQPRAGVTGLDVCPARRRLSRPAARDRRRRAGAVGGAPARRRRSRGCSSSPMRFEVAGQRRTRNAPITC